MGQLGVWGSAVSSPSASGAESQPKSNLVPFSLKIWHQVATISIIFLRINWPNFVRLNSKDKSGQSQKYLGRQCLPLPLIKSAYDLANGTPTRNIFSDWRNVFTINEKVVLLLYRTLRYMKIEPWQSCYCCFCIWNVQEAQLSQRDRAAACLNFGKNISAKSVHLTLLCYGLRR